MAETRAGRDVGAVSVCHPGVSFGQWQRVHQSRDCWVAEQITDRADEIPPTAFQRQWSGRGQEWSGDPQTHGLPLHRRAARGKGPGVLPEHLNPYLNFHRPCGQPEIRVDAKGKERRVYPRYATPWEAFQALPKAEQYLKPGLTRSEEHT